ncbi:MAG: quinolinate synthase NadA [Bacteroidales bacterium]|jgi:quinolinate synthase|nr:quinolinate synthase NadA [Bacteroidales bacterium]
MNNNSWLKTGFVTELVPEGINLTEEINRMKHEKNAVIMAHYYQTADIQNIADCIGDSLALAQMATKTDASIIVLAGVYFMGETAKILSPHRKVIVPDANAGCSLADSCCSDEFSRFIAEHPNHKVVTYVNTTAAVKALSDLVVTSTNAVKIVQSIPIDQPVIFGPDRNLGNYINGLTGRNMLLWNGACHVHEKFSVEKILALKQLYPNAEVLAHPECKQPVLMISDFVGSTAALLAYSQQSTAKEFIVATEAGILHEMQRHSPQKNFIPAPPNDSTCACNDCEYMKLITLEKIYLSLKYEFPLVEVDETIRQKALIPIERMLKLSK